MRLSNAQRWDRNIGDATRRAEDFQDLVEQPRKLEEGEFTRHLEGNQGGKIYLLKVIINMAVRYIYILTCAFKASQSILRTHRSIMTPGMTKIGRKS